MRNKHSLEANFDATFTAVLAQREKQIQQNYRPIIGIHKWFARRPGTVFRTLLLAEFHGEEPLESSYWRAHDLEGVIADPFMGGGTTIYEANRLGLNVVGTDINPMAFWVVKQSLASLDLDAFSEAARAVIGADTVGLTERSLQQTRGDSIHRLDKFDTKEGKKSLQYAAAENVPYPVLLYERTAATLDRLLAHTRIREFVSRSKQEDVHVRQETSTASPVSTYQRKPRAGTPHASDRISRYSRKRRE